MTGAPSLYDIADTLRVLLDAVPDETEDAEFDALLANTEGAFADKVEALVALASERDHLAAARRTEGKRMIELAASGERSAQRLRDYVLRSMQKVELQKLDTRRFRLAVRANPGHVVIDDEARVPDHCWRFPPPPAPSVDKEAITRAIRAGEMIPGAHLEVTVRLDVR